MHSPDRLPIRQGTPSQPPPLKRHHSAHYYAHRVRESLTTRVSKTLCVIFLSLLLIVGIIMFILWLSLRPHRPRFHIHEFSIPGLAQATGFENAELNFNVTARNPNQHIGIYYSSTEAFVYYKDQRVGATPLAEPFYQEPKNTTIMAATLSGATLTVNSQRWTEFMNDRAQGRVAFRLEIVSSIRFKVSTWWESKHHRMHANCDAIVGQDGLLLATSTNKRCTMYFT
ncbi:hypothetical protein Pint_10875 [Pistacia integerrima]|uniref:Uncharacterized protein n=1 Tax=Pistacia integerrima TaxID=434235 RepID=A0ACC0XKS9_9ROSI|nr:hypothetical protein Pint_10875 [Pistacia integerrima]